MSDPGASAHTSEALATLRVENQLRVEQLRARRLNAYEQRFRRRELIESLSLDWVTPYAELLDLTRYTGDPLVTGPASFWQRQQGRNWPIYQTEQELMLLRAPARILLATNGYAQGLVEGLTSYGIGSGCTYRMGKVSDHDTDTPQELIDAAQRIVDQLLERNDWHGGQCPGVEQECFGRSIEDGEFIIAHFFGEDGWTEYRIQEPEQLTQPPGSDWMEWSFGVETPRNDAAKHLRYWLQYGDTPSQGEEYDPDEITHFRRNVRRSMKRGITDLCFDTYNSLYLAGRLRTNLGDTAAQQAAITYVMQYENAAVEDVNAYLNADADFTQQDQLTGQTRNIKLHRRGEEVHIPKGQNYVAGPIATATPIHVQVLDALLRGAGQKWQAPPWLMSGDLNAMNYATSLTAESPFVKTMQRQQSMYCNTFRRAIWLGLRHYVRTHGLRDRNGRVWEWEDVETRLKLSVTAPDPQTRNKLEESQRAQVEIALGVQSRQAYMQEQGRDPDKIEADNQEYQDKFGAPGNPLPTDPGQVPAPTPAAAGGMPKIESVLLESGFTGEITDKAGHKRHYVDGKEVAAPKAAPAGQQPAGKTAAPWPAHPVAAHFQDALKNSPNLTPEQREEYGHSIASVLSRIPKKGLDRIAENIKSTHFHPDLKSVGLAATDAALASPALTEKQRASALQRRQAIENGESSIGGVYLKIKEGSQLHVDGGFSHGMKRPGLHGGYEDARAIKGHELAHAIDGPQHIASRSAPWTAAFEEEIGPKGNVSGQPRLTDYAQKDVTEGWAEFGRLVYASDIPLATIEKHFPKCSAIWKAAGIWPQETQKAAA